MTADNSAASEQQPRRWTHKHEPEFDRTVCPEPCGMMHNYCTHCGLLLDDCPHERRDRADG